jgi:hypothetical protein
MLVLTATTELQGREWGDYAHTVEGELVTPLVSACDNQACGRNRGFAGLASSRATTTAIVADLPLIDIADLRDAVLDSLERGGWLDVLEHCAEEHGDDPLEVIEEIIDEHVEVIGQICAAYPVGTVVNRLNDLVTARHLPSAA